MQSQRQKDDHKSSGLSTGISYFWGKWTNSKDTIARRALMHRAEASRLYTKLQILLLVPREITHGPRKQGGRGRTQISQQGEKRPALGLELQNYPRDMEKREASVELGGCKPPASWRHCVSNRLNMQGWVECSWAITQAGQPRCSSIHLRALTAEIYCSKDHKGTKFRLRCLSIARQSKKTLSAPVGTLALRNVYPSLAFESGSPLLATGAPRSICFDIAVWKCDT